MAKCAICEKGAHFGNNVSGERAEEEVTERTRNGNQYGIEDVTGERYPGGGHTCEHITEVGERRVYDVELRGVVPELVERLQGLDDRIVHRDKHKCAEDKQEYCDSHVASRRTVEDNFMISSS